jgi:hypothetical protein
MAGTLIVRAQRGINKSMQSSLIQLISAMVSLADVSLADVDR